MIKNEDELSIGFTYLGKEYFMERKTWKKLNGTTQRSLVVAALLELFEIDGSKFALKKPKGSENIVVFTKSQKNDLISSCKKFACMSNLSDSKILYYIGRNSTYRRDKKRKELKDAMTVAERTDGSDRENENEYEGNGDSQISSSDDDN